MARAALLRVLQARAEAVRASGLRDMPRLLWHDQFGLPFWPELLHPTGLKRGGG